MSVSLQEILEYAGYDINTVADAKWLRSKEREWEELIERASDTIDKKELEEGIQDLQDEINDNNTSEDTKKVLRETLAQQRKFYAKYYSGHDL